MQRKVVSYTFFQAIEDNEGSQSFWWKNLLLCMCASSTFLYLFSVSWQNALSLSYVHAQLKCAPCKSTRFITTHAFVVQTLLIWQEVMIYKSISTFRWGPVNPRWQSAKLWIPQTRQKINPTPWKHAGRDFYFPLNLTSKWGPWNNTCWRVA